MVPRIKKYSGQIKKYLSNAVFSIINFDLLYITQQHNNWFSKLLLVKVALSGWNIRPAELNKRSIATLDGSRKNGDYSCKFTTH